MFKITLVSKIGLGDLMKKYAEREGLLSQSRKMLFSSFSFNNGTLITLLLLFYLDLDLVCTKTYRFVEYIAKKCFNNSVHSAVDARRQGDENPKLSKITEKMKMLANSSYCNHIMDRSRHTLTKYLSDEKTHAAINNKMFTGLGFIHELAKSANEHKKQFFCWIFHSGVCKVENAGAVL